MYCRSTNIPEKPPWYERKYYHKDDPKKTLVSVSLDIAGRGFPGDYWLTFADDDLGAPANPQWFWENHLEAI